MRHTILAALCALAIAAPIRAQDSLATSNAPAPTQVRLPLVRSVTDGSRVVLQVVGATDAPSGETVGQYIGPAGYVTTAAQAQDIRGPSGSTATQNAVPGPMGAPGKSAYQSWLDEGNTGTESDFIASLRGAQGLPGTTGGTGAAGQSAYALWLAQGNTGTAAQFLASLTGATGASGSNGTNGASAELRAQGGYVQWRVGTGAWANLVALSDLTGPAGATGSTGAAGAKGDTGATPVLAIGTVATLAPGSQATASLAGSAAAPVLNLGLVTGSTGQQGTAGAPGSTGSTGAAGSNGVSPVLSIGTVSTLSSGASATAVLGGTTSAPILNLGLPVGAPGATGAAGATGATGTAATIALGTVTKLAAGSSPTVSNTGTSSAAVLNFGLPGNEVFLTDVTLAQTSLLSLQISGVQTFTVSTNCVAGDRLLMVPGGVIPAGYMLGDIYCSASGTATAKLFTPQLGLGTSYSITAKVVAFR